MKMTTYRFRVKSNEKLISAISNSSSNLHPLTTKTKIGGVYTVNTNIWLPAEIMEENVEEDTFAKLSGDYYL